ncbi:MAG: carboxypeptidase-like regulatory domain-containing protein [Thermoanaerobaculia bacterium]
MTLSLAPSRKSSLSPRSCRAIAWSLFHVLVASGLLAGTIKGTVTGPTGTKLPKIVVAAYGTSGSAQAAVETDSKGSYSLSLPPGEFRLLAYDNAGVYATTFAGNAESFETSPTVSGDRSGYDFTLTEGGKASGTVSGADGGGIGDITVVAYNPSGTRRGFTSTSSNGAYALVLPPGSYKFVAYDNSTNPRFLTSFFPGKNSFESADFVSIRTQAPVVVDFRLRASARIAGIVSDKQSHAPQPGLVVSAYTVEGVLVASTMTDGLGRYELIVSDGIFRLLVADPGRLFATAFYAGANSFEKTPGVTLTPGQSLANVSLEAERGGYVSGRVTAAGTAVCCIVVVAYNPDGSQRSSTRADQNGAYQLVLPPGDFIIGAYDESLTYAPRFHASSTTFRGATSVTVLRSQTVLVDLSLDRSARVSGRVFDPTTGAGIGSILVSAYDSSGNLAATVTTSASGSYLLGLAAGSYRLVAFDPSLRYATGYPQLAATFEEAPAYDLVAEATRSVDFALNKGTRVTGTVVDPSRTPLSGIEIGALSTNGNRVATTTARNGAFDLVLPPGSYKLVAIDPRGRYGTLYFNSAGSFANATTVVVTASGSTPGTVNFILPPQLRHRSVGR